jgi:hypothetical protein
MAKKLQMPLYLLILLAFGALVVVVNLIPGARAGICPGSQMYCPGVGCVSGPDKCFPGARGGASAVFSKETFFTKWPGSGVGSTPPIYGEKENFVDKKCPDGTRSDGPCLMEF